MSGDKVTARPWRLSGIGIEDYSGFVVTHTGCTLDFDGPTEQDAAHIVKCVNNHERLVKVLDKATKRSKLDWMQEAIDLLDEIRLHKATELDT